MILTGPEIERWVRDGWIHVDPYDARQLNPASYDVRLGKRYGFYSGSPREWTALDSKKEHEFEIHDISDQGFWVHPGQLYLMHTEERFGSDRCVTFVDGKSSVGRLGVLVHVTAGNIDPGFFGQCTLEVTSVAHPVRLYAGMRIAQLRFHQLAGDVELYRGHYRGATAEGPVPSACWRQFAEDSTRGGEPGEGG